MKSAKDYEEFYRKAGEETLKLMDQYYGTTRYWPPLPWHKRLWRWLKAFA